MLKNIDLRVAVAGLRRNGQAVMACCLLSGACSTVAWTASDGTPINFDIPAQPLAASLNRAALQANVQIVFEPASVAGYPAPAVAGSMTIDSALKALLVRTNLTYIQNPDGTIVVRPVAVVRTVSTMRAVKAPETVAATRTVQEEVEGPWTLRVREVFRDPDNRDDLWLGNSWSTEVGAQYNFDPHLSSELSFGLPNRHTLWQRNVISSSGQSMIDSVAVSSHFLTLKYQFLPKESVRPYLGAGISQTHIHGQYPARASLERNSWAPVAQAGIDLKLGKHWLLNADLKYSLIRPAISLSGVPSGRMKADPFFVGIGIGYRMGVIREVAVAQPVVVQAAPPPSVEPPAPPPPPSPPAPPADSDHDGILDPADRCPGTLPGVKVDAQGCEIEAVVLKGVNFATDSAELTGDSAGVLDAVVAALRQRPGSKAQIHGYTDDRGRNDHNQRLSELRAAAVASYLQQHGVQAGALSSQGHGESDPVATNSTADGRAMNRRVTVQFSTTVMK